MKKSKGFSAVEIILTIAVMGIVAAVGIPLFIGVRSNMARSNAMNNATLIDTAVTAYKQDVRNAAANYTGAADKYALLKGAGYLQGAPSTLASMADDGYTYTMPATVNDTTTVLKDGTAVPRN